MSERRKRRKWSVEEKRRIVAQARVPGVSVSQVARRYDMNANLIFKWLRDPRFASAADDGTDGPASATSFLPVELAAAPRLDPPVTEPVSAPEASKLEIVLANGHRISVSGAYDPDALSRLVRGLGS